LVKDIRKAVSELFETRIKIDKRMSKIKYKIAILSGKGGVGKTTISVNLAVGLAVLGYKVGIIDADIYGPNIPIALGTVDKKPLGSKEGILPVSGKYGIKVMSVQYFLQRSDEPLVWGGSLVSKAIIQFLRDVVWDELDFLIIDLPPGTGDEALTVFQFLRSLTGVIIVTTPQKIAISDVKKAINMCKKMNINILGIVENMSYFKCPYCGSEFYLFGKKNIDSLLSEFRGDFLARIPIDPIVTEATDKGEPLVLQSNQIGEIFRNMVKRLLSKINPI